MVCLVVGWLCGGWLCVCCVIFTDVGCVVCCALFFTVCLFCFVFVFCFVGCFVFLLVASWMWSVGASGYATVRESTHNAVIVFALAEFVCATFESASLSNSNL